MVRLGTFFGISGCLAVLGCGLAAQEVVPEETAASGQNCSWIASPEEVQQAGLRARQDAYERTLQFTKSLSTSKARAARAVRLLLDWRAGRGME